MCSHTIRCIPFAASITEIPSGLAICVSIAFSARSKRKRTEPLRLPCGSRYPMINAASVTVGNSPPSPYAAGPGLEPALSGPTLSKPFESMWAILPPPAPISIRSTVGKRTGRPLPFLKRCCLAASKSVVTEGFPFAIRQALAVVPPISNAKTSATLAR